MAAFGVPARPCWALCASSHLTWALLLPVQASIAANTYVVSGNGEQKSEYCAAHCCCCCWLFLPCSSAVRCSLPRVSPELQDLLPDIINQLGPDSISSIRKLAESYQAPAAAGGAGGVR